MGSWQDDNGRGERGPQLPPEYAAVALEDGDLGGARGHQEAVLEALRRLLGDEHPDTLTARNNLAVIVEAIESSERQQPVGTEPEPQRVP